LRPFSPGDNLELERAWLKLGRDRDRRNHEQAIGRYCRSSSPASPSSSTTLSKENAEKLAAIVALLVAKHKEKHDREGQQPFLNSSGLQDPQGASSSAAAGSSSSACCCLELPIDASGELRREFCAVTRRRWQQSLNQEQVVLAVMAQLNRMWASNSDSFQAGSPVRSSLAAFPALGTSAPIPSGHALIPTVEARSYGSLDGLGGGGGSGPLPPPAAGLMAARPPVLDDGISGKPFVRVANSSNRSSGYGTPEDTTSRSAKRLSSSSAANVRIGTVEARNMSKRVAEEALEQARDAVEIPVGISRLHMVSLPVLQMKPIYWSPVNDIATVLRATWFYRDTMVPVEPAVANQLEAGYRELRPWTETWQDELRSALDVGALGEEKVSHRLWPDPAEVEQKLKRLSKTSTKDGNSGQGSWGLAGLPLEPPISSDPFCAARCFRGEAAAEGTLEPVQSDEEDNKDDELADSLIPEPPKAYSKSHVIYKNATAAFLLKPSQKPSAYYGRRPVAKIMKGITVGLPVVRGFDWNTWERVHEKNNKGSRGVRGIGVAAKLAQQHQRRHTNTTDDASCPGCQAEKDRGQVTDLVLIAHGIGQKFAERVESFHFTHAVNSFRRAVNVELENPAVKSVLRPDQNGIMVLPVNWRHLLSFEDGGPTTNKSSPGEGDDENETQNFGLKDIEPGTIPAVRSMISDVMFDIPFYMSQHKPKMIAALVGEANRVYRLWCRNNPGWTEKGGRVHLIGHSLGSAMAIEVLSKQPTTVPRPLDLKSPIETRHFEFDTTNLFLLGSPAAFFLLLERGGLVPRRGRLKPGADAADSMARDVVGEVGRFGCIAVDNIYNILAKEDPIAYLLNGTVDPVYAASLKTAYVPNFKNMMGSGGGGGWLPWFGGSGSGGGSGGSATAAGASSTGTGTTATTNDNTNKPPGALQSMLFRLPSQLELEVHDFSREEVAEKKAFLLNDNGQIDWYLRSGGGPLEIQYLNMLSAHTSYWTNMDLIRFLCVEVGRKPGREHTLPAVRAVKVPIRLNAKTAAGGKVGLGVGGKR